MSQKPKRPSMFETLSRIKAADDQIKEETEEAVASSVAAESFQPLQEEASSPIPMPSPSAQSIPEPGPVPSAKVPSKYKDRPTITMGVNLPVDLHRRLALVAQERRYQMHAGKGRASASDVIVELLEKHLPDMEQRLGLAGAGNSEN